MNTKQQVMELWRRCFEDTDATVREIAAFGGDLSQFVPEAVAVELKKKMNTKGECNHEQPH